MTDSLSEIDDRYWEARVADGAAEEDDDDGSDIPDASEIVEYCLSDVQICPITALYPIRRDTHWDVFLEVETDAESIWLKDRVEFDSLDTLAESVVFPLWNPLYATVDGVCGAPVLVHGIQRVRAADRHEYVEVTVDVERGALPSSARVKCPAEVRYARSDETYEDQRTEFITQIGLWALYELHGDCVPVVITDLTPVTQSSVLVTAESAYAQHVQLRWILSLDDADSNPDATAESATDQLLDSVGCGHFSEIRGGQVYLAPIGSHPPALFTGNKFDQWGVYLSPPPNQPAERSSRVLHLARSVCQRLKIRS